MLVTVITLTKIDKLPAKCTAPAQFVISINRAIDKPLLSKR